MTISVADVVIFEIIKIQLESYRTWKRRKTEKQKSLLNNFLKMIHVTQLKL